MIALIVDFVDRLAFVRYCLIRRREWFAYYWFLVVRLAVTFLVAELVLSFYIISLACYRFSLVDIVAVYWG